MGSSEPTPEELISVAKKLRKEIQDAEGGAEEGGTSPPAETSKSVVSKGGDGALYDDEIPEVAPKDMLSDNMRSRLLNEAKGLGADYNTATPNYILYIGVVVGLLVVVGGQGILF